MIENVTDIYNVTGTEYKKKKKRFASARLHYGPRYACGYLTDKSSAHYLTNDSRASQFLFSLFSFSFVSIFLSACPVAAKVPRDRTTVFWRWIAGNAATRASTRVCVCVFITALAGKRVLLPRQSERFEKYEKKKKRYSL